MRRRLSISAPHPFPLAAVASVVRTICSSTPCSFSCSSAGWYPRGVQTSDPRTGPEEPGVVALVPVVVVRRAPLDLICTSSAFLWLRADEVKKLVTSAAASDALPIPAAVAEGGEPRLAAEAVLVELLPLGLALCTAAAQSIPSAGAVAMGTKRCDGKPVRIGPGREGKRPCCCCRCCWECEKQALEVAPTTLAATLGLSFIFLTSTRRPSRTSATSFRSTDKVTFSSHSFSLSLALVVEEQLMNE